MENLIISSPFFEHGGLIPVEYTGYGADCSPELMLTGLSRDAVSIAIIMNDMSHPIPAYNHWVIWNIPATSVIPGKIPYGEQVDSLGGAIQGLGYGKHRYRGPKPPFRWSHTYHFNVFVLDCILSLPSTSKKKDLIVAMQGHILQQAVASPPIPPIPPIPHIPHIPAQTRKTPLPSSLLALPHSLPSPQDSV